jgi:ABC transporter, permease protein
MNKTVLKNKTKGVGVSVLRMLFLLAFEFVLLYPVIFMISNSFKVTSDTLNPAVKWFSLSPTTYGYKVAWMAFDYWNGLKITFLFGIVSGLIEVVTCAVYAYGLSRFELRFKKIWMFLLIVTILIPDVMLIIPRILNFRYMDVFGILGLFYKLTGVDLRVNITDTVWTFYLPSLFGVGLKGGLFIYIYMQFFKGLPKELEEAAWIDGAGPVQTFIRIIIPSSGVVILTVFIFSFIWHWNDWLLATMYTENNHTLAFTLRNISGYIGQLWSSMKISADSSAYYGAPLAACLMFIAPPTLLYVILQRHFIESVDRVGIVG